MAVPAGLVLGLYAVMTLLSPPGAGAIKADHMGSYGPAFYQSYDASGQFTHEFDGEQLFSVDLKTREVVWRLPEFGDLARFDLQTGLISIAMIRAHLGVLVERSNGTKATSGTCPVPRPAGQGSPASLPSSRPREPSLSPGTCSLGPSFSRIASQSDRAPQVSSGAGQTQRSHLHRGQHLPPRDQCHLAAQRSTRHGGRVPDQFLSPARSLVPQVPLPDLCALGGRRLRLQGGALGPGRAAPHALGAPAGRPAARHHRDPGLRPGPGHRPGGLRGGHRPHHHRRVRVRCPQVQRPGSLDRAEQAGAGRVTEGMALLRGADSGGAFWSPRF